MHPFDSESFNQRYGNSLPIAIIGGGCRFPKARSIFEFWRRLADGEELISRFDAQALQQAGLDPSLLARPDFVPAAAVVEQMDQFEWSFFGYSKQEAQSIDPQQRLFLMCAWDALEMAGYLNQTDAHRIGVIGSSRMSTYRFAEEGDLQQIATPTTFQSLIGNDKDYLATRVAYKLGLTGPAYTVQTACSSSLVATHLACETIASGEADMMLAGGASLSFPQQSGYFYREGMIFSPDGHCRPFDANAQGTLVGNGGAVVLLKRLDKALQDGDAILSVIRGSAINNDGNDKAGFTAPSFSGQSKVIREALELSDVDASAIGMVEAHGTATPLGDPIEISALTDVWSHWSAKKQQAAIGSLKSNVGHLDTAAGIGSLLKASLAIWHGQVPPSLNYEHPNPAIDFANSPFFVPQQLIPWPNGSDDCSDTRLAAVSSFGIGGTNAHAILETAPMASQNETAEATRPLLLSARSEQALKDLAYQHMVRLMDREAGFDAASYSATSCYHRSLFDQRLLILADNPDDWVSALIDFVEDVPAEEACGPVEQHHSEHASAELTVINVAAVDTAPWLAQALAEAPEWSSLVRPTSTRALMPVAPFSGKRCWLESNHGKKHTNVADSAWQALARRAEQTAQEELPCLDLSLIDEEKQCIDALHQLYVGQMLNKLALFTVADEFKSVRQLMQQARIPDQFSDLMHRLLRDLCSTGALESQHINNDVCYGNLHPEEVDLPYWIGRMQEAGYHNLSQLVTRAGPRLAEMLRQEVDPVSIIFPAAATDDVEHMYREQPGSRYLNEIATQAVVSYSRAQKKPIAIWEIGAGTGSTSQGILQNLDANACHHYSFTDVGSLFLQRAQDKFAAYPFMAYSLFDIEKPADQQNLPLAQYDVIVAANVLHNASDLRTMLANIASRLKPGGILLMREITEQKKLFDFIFGPMVPPIKDTALRHGELFAAEQVWYDALKDTGFERWDAFPGAENPASALGEKILIAQRPDVATTEPTDTQQNTAVIVDVPASANTEQGNVWHSNAITQAVRHAVASQRPHRMQDIHWYQNPTGAASPLSLSVIYQADWVRVMHQQQPLFDARLAPARIEAIDTSEFPSSPNEQCQYHWQWQAIELPAPDHSLSTMVLHVPDQPDSQSAFFTQLQQQLQFLPDGSGLILHSQRLLDETHDHPASWLPGLLTVARHEYPGIKLQLLDLVDQPLTPAMTQAIAVSDYGELRYHPADAQWQAPKLVSSLAQRPVRQTPQGCQLLIGGLTPLGFALANDLINKGADHFYWLTRRQPSPHERFELEQLKTKAAKRGIELTIAIDATVNLQTEDSLESALQRVHEKVYTVDAIWHLAGAVDDRPLQQMQWPHLADNLQVRLQTAKRLHAWQHRLQPQLTVYFSSAASILGPKGQTSHAAACRALEQFAHYRCQQGYDTLAVAWGHWDITASTTQTQVQHFADTGMLSLPTDVAIQQLNAALNSEQSVIGIMKLDWHKLARQTNDAHDQLRFAPFLTAPEAKPQAKPAAPTAQSPHENTSISAQALQLYVLETLAKQLKCEVSDIRLDGNLVQLGLDSLLFLDLNETFNRDLGIKLNAELIFKANSVSELISILAQSVSHEQDNDHSTLRQAMNALEKQQPGWLDQNGDIAREVAQQQLLPLTRLQQLRWQHHEQTPMLLYVEYKLATDFPIDNFVHGWQRLLQRHPILRTGVTAQGFMRVFDVDQQQLDAQHADLRPLSVDEQRRRRQAVREQLSSHTFDLTQPPHLLLQTTRTDDELRLHLVINTLLIDIESFRILLRELKQFTDNPEIALPESRFSPLAYQQALIALQDTAPAQQIPDDALQVPQLPWQKGKGQHQRFTIWRDELPANLWLRLKAAAENRGLTGTDVLSALWALVLRDWNRAESSTLRLNFTDRLPLHAHASQLVADASTLAPLTLNLQSADSFTALAQQACDIRTHHLEQCLPGSEQESFWLESLPVAFTSLLGVRQSYSIPETSDPLLGMPSYEYASQPLTPLHLQALEEESALLFNIDQQQGWLPEELGDIAMATIAQLLHTLAELDDAWQVPLTELLPVDPQIVELAAAAREHSE